MIKNSSRVKDSPTGHGHFISPFKVVLTLLFLSLTIYVLALANYSIMSADSYYTGTINVSGHGEVEMKPDVQKLSIEIASTTATSTTEYAKRIITYLRSKGISNSDIKILSMRSVEVNLRGINIDRSKAIASDVEKISVKYITPTLSQPEIENPSVLKSRALDMALADAKMNALKVSQALGADLGKVISYDDGAYGDNYNPDLGTADITVSYQIR